MGVYYIYPLLGETTYPGLEIFWSNDYFFGYLTSYLAFMDLKKKSILRKGRTTKE